MASVETLTAAKNYRLFILNTEFLKSFASVIKLGQICGAVICMIVLTTKSGGLYCLVDTKTELFTLLMLVSNFMGSCMLYISYAVSKRTADTISASIYDLIFHSMATVMYFFGSLSLLVVGTVYGINDRYIVVSVFGFTVFAFYLYSSIKASRKT